MKYENMDLKNKVHNKSWEREEGKLRKKIKDMAIFKK